MTRGAVRCSAWLGVAVVRVRRPTSTGQNDESVLRMKVRKDQNRATVETDASVGNDAKQETPEPDAAGRVKPWTSEAGIESGQALEQESLDRMRVATPNDPKLSDCGGRRGSCAAGLRGAGAVTPGAVRCSAWLGVSGRIGEGVK